jgi:xanthine dehydrogenase large subunit
LHIALVASEQAHARIVSIDTAEILASPGVVAVFDAKDIPGVNDCGPIIHDDPILADGFVQFIGQPILIVVAKSYDQARRAARKAHIEYDVLEPVLNVEQAFDRQSFVLPPMRLASADVEQQLADSALNEQGEFSIGGQEHFYLEGQVSYVQPKEDGCLHVWTSTQHPSEMQQVVAHMLQRDASQIVVEMRRMGGGFGGKESQSALYCCATALAAELLQQPVKCRLDRDDDMLMTGKRHHFNYRYRVGYETDGLIRALQIEMLVGAGFSADLSGPVAIRALCHADNAYHLAQSDISAYCCKTNTQSNTAFRGFGGPQGAFATEYIIDSMARELGVDPLDLRKRNFYGKHERNQTPYGQIVEDNVIQELVEQLETSSDYRQRRNSIEEFNTQSPLIRKGLALTPVKFGISFNVRHFNQAGALVHVYTDGSVLVSHGGTEMGQGLHTKVLQVVANELGISVDRVRISATDTSKVANTSATAASTGADLNAKAAQQAAMQIRQRLTDFIGEKFNVSATDVVFAANQVSAGERVWSFDELIPMAYQDRLQLWSDGFYKTPGLSWDHESLTGNPFYYYAYGAAVSEVAIDTLTGEFRLLRADLLHDAGNSINPAIDKGQVEGGFIQGMGWLTSEELVWNDDGRLMTHAPSTYKIPAVSDCPVDFRVELFNNKNVKDSIMRSKAVGEPPLLLAFSVFFAIRDAIASVAGGRINPPLNAPATPEQILNAVEYCKEQAA